MKKTVTRQLQEMMSDYVSDEQMQKLEKIFKAYENFEISNYRLCYTTAKFDHVCETKKNVDDFINEKFGCNE